MSGEATGRTIVALDTETTGIGRFHRVVSFAAVKVVEAEVLAAMGKGKFIAYAMHLVFDPRRNSDPDAMRVHGWDDWTLRHQDLFGDWANVVHGFLTDADLLVAHSASFDMEMLEREFERSGCAPLRTPVSCTMQMARTRWPGQRVRLDDCLARVGRERTGERHGAAEDALLALHLYMFLEHGVTLPASPTVPPPSNLRDYPPRPDGPLPRRTRKQPKQ